MTAIFIFAFDLTLNSIFIIFLTNRTEEHRQDEAERINDSHFLKFRKLINEEFCDPRNK